jgi:serine/threonine protein kinase
MAPEQRLGENASVKSDVFSAGVTLYEMLTGETPWKDINHLPTDRRAWATIVPPSNLYKEIPAALDQLVLKAIDLQPGRRFNTANEMADELKKMRYAPQSDLIAWASGRKSNVNLNTSENKKTDNQVRQEVPKNKAKQIVEKKKKENNKRWLWVSGLVAGLLICLFISGFFFWKSLNPSNNIAFQDDFSNTQTTTSQWSPISGNWQVVNGSYYCSTSDNKCLSTINSIPNGNFTLSVDVYGQDGIDKSIYFGIIDQQYYRVSLRSDPINQMILSEVNGNQPEKVLSQTSWQISDQKWYKLKLVFKDQTLSVYIDDQLVASTTNTIFKQSGGKIGVGIEPIANGTSTINSAAFDNFQFSTDN